MNESVAAGRSAEGNEAAGARETASPEGLVILPLAAPGVGWLIRGAQRNSSAGTGKDLVVLLACFFVVMTGLGITIPVLPFYVERIAQAVGVSHRSTVLHLELLTGAYALMQLIFAPLWGRWSDRLGRKPLILLGVAGYVVAPVLFGLARSLWLLYIARLIGGIMSSAALPVAAAYVVDVTSDDARGRGMAWLGAAASLGVVVGAAFGGMLSRNGLHLILHLGHFMVDSLSIPFFVAALLALFALCAAIRWLRETMPSSAAGDLHTVLKADWGTLATRLSPLLALAFIGQLALTMFEATFALFAQAKFNFGPVGVGAGFVVCGLVMSAFQAGAVGFLSRKVGELWQIGAGFATMGLGIALLAAARTPGAVYAFVALLALGMAFIAPNLAALISKRGGAKEAGAALGIQNAANSLGQALGPLLGGLLLLWQINAPYLFSGTLLVALALPIGWQAMRRQRSAKHAGLTGQIAITKAT